MAQLVLTAHLARHTHCPETEIPTATLGQLFKRYFPQWPAVRGYVLDNQGAVRKNIMVLIDGLNLLDRQSFNDALRPESSVYVFQALSGGVSTWRIVDAA